MNGQFFVLRELIFAIRKNCFFLLGFNFCDFQKVEHEIKVKQHADIKRARKQVPSDDPFL